ncbi:carbohydrate ABC transporter permease [Luteimicrobium sp. NPDC057192]|uniref:carbohydrate ABC transporter permease n=1 Tax=Luteimicrobium sp. NPDC057192 TaxID=3346042 RepID=UPI0036383083
MSTPTLQDDRTANDARAPRATTKPRRQVRAGSHLLLLAFAVYFLIPLWWLLVASTKSNSGLFVGSGGPLWFNGDFNFVENVKGLFTHDGGIYWTWFRNSFVYALAGGVGATLLSLLAGYGFAMYRFRGRAFLFSVLLGSLMIPATALVIPTFVLLSDFNLIDTMWAVILPSLLSPIGVYLIRVYAQEALPQDTIDAARVDGAGELRTFFRVSVPLLRPAVVTVLLLTTVATWNNFFLPLAVLRSQKLLPVTVGLSNWQALSSAGAGNEQAWNLIVTGALLSIVPLIVAFLALQRYWQSGLTLGSVK